MNKKNIFWLTAQIYVLQLFLHSWSSQNTRLRLYGFYHPRWPPNDDIIAPVRSVVKKTRIFIMIIWKIGLKLSIWTLVSITDFFLTGATHKPQFFKGLSTADRFRICFPHSRFSYLAPKFAKKTKFIECTSSTMKLIVSKMTVKFPWIFE